MDSPLEPTARLVEVKRFALRDGPGVRTSFFLKGCPLQCRWCHNPESIAPEAELAYFAHKCLHCGECVAICAAGAHRLEEGRHIFDRRRCIACGACEEACLGGALRLFGREMTVAQAAGVALEDRDFYEPDGGITLSGGEPLLQADFCVELFRRLGEEGLHRALDTAGVVPWDRFERVLPHTDLFLYDLKQMDSARHQSHTGRPNQAALNNLGHLSRHGVPIEIRIPIIPGFNDHTESVAAFGRYLGDLPNLRGVRLLAYHDHARSKLAAIGRGDTMPRVPPPGDEPMRLIAAQLSEFGLAVLL